MNDDKIPDEKTWKKLKSFRVTQIKMNEHSFNFILPKFWINLASIKAGDVLDLFLDVDNYNLLIKPVHRDLSVSSDVEKASV